MRCGLHSKTTDFKKVMDCKNLFGERLEINGAIPKKNTIMIILREQSKLYLALFFPQTKVAEYTRRLTVISLNPNTKIEH